MVKSNRSTRKTGSIPTKKNAANKQKGTLSNETVVSLWASRDTFLVYHNDKEVSGGMSKEKATSMYGILPESVKKGCEVMSFKCQDDYDKFMKTFVSEQPTEPPTDTEGNLLTTNVHGTNVHGTSVVSPEKPLPVTAAKAGFAGLKNRLTETLNKPYADTKVLSDKKKGHIDILNRLKKVVALPPNVVKIHFFPNTPACAKASVVMLEFCKRSDGFNMWLHKPEAWQSVLQADVEFLILPEALKDMTHCVHRSKPFVDGNIEKVKKSGNYTIKASGLCFPVAVGMGEDDIRQFVSTTFAEITSNPEFQECYSLVVAQLGSSAKTMQAIPGYYKDFVDALRPEMILMIPHFSLDEVFTSKMIDVLMTFVSGTSLSDSASKKYSADGYERNHFEEFAFKP